MIWAEADKLGWFINTVTEPVLAKEKQVVKNEKRQRVDNQPYGHTNYIIDKNMYPENHPYNWQVIDSLEDLQNATLADVKEFFNSWYVPNNTTLVISGDFNVDQAKSWVHKYFDEIPAGKEITPLTKRAGRVDEIVKLYHEDNFARLSELTLAWPTVELYHPDSYPLAILANYLSRGKSAPLYQQLVESDQLTSEAQMINRASELAGQTRLTVRAFANKDLDNVLVSVQKALANFEAEGISENDLNRIKAGQETRFYNSLSSVLGKGFQLAQYDIFADDPGFINQDIQNILDVTSDDVMRVYNKYFKNQEFIATSFVPKGSVAQALEGSTKAAVVEETISPGAEETFDPSITASYEPTPATFDRSIEPPYGEAPQISIPDVWEDELSNGLEVFGIENNEVPLVRFNIVIAGGQLLEDMDKVGVSNLLASLMTRVTKNKTPQELEEANQLLGTTINVRAGQENITISGNTLSKNYKETIGLLEEIILEPRWDDGEFDLAVEQVISQIQQQEANPNSVAQNTFNVLIYGEDNIKSKNILGSIESVENITMDDLKAYYSRFSSPSIFKMHIVGAMDKSSVLNSLQDLADGWESKDVTIPAPDVPDAPDAPDAPEQSQVFFYDVPDAKQSVLRIGHPALSATDVDYYPAIVANYILGGGDFASRLIQELREGNGYTYDIDSSFSGSETKGPFVIRSGARSNVTLESTQLVKHILENYAETYSEKDLETTKSFLIKSNARAFETADAKLDMLQNISAYGWPYDYLNHREEIVGGMTVDRIKELSEKYFNEDKMFWLVVGDARTQLDRMKNLGFGDPILINDTSGKEQ